MSQRPSVGRLAGADVAMEGRLDRATDDGSSDSPSAACPPPPRASPPVADSSGGVAEGEELVSVTTPERSGSAAATSEGDPDGDVSADDDGRREGTPVHQPAAARQPAEDSPRSSSGQLSVSPGGEGLSPPVLKRGPGRPRKDGSSPVQRKKL